MITTVRNGFSHFQLKITDTDNGEIRIACESDFGGINNLYILIGMDGNGFYIKDLASGKRRLVRDKSKYKAVIVVDNLCPFCGYGPMDPDGDVCSCSKHWIRVDDSWVCGNAGL